MYIYNIVTRSKTQEIKVKQALIDSGKGTDTLKEQ